MAAVDGGGSGGGDSSLLASSSSWRLYWSISFCRSDICRSISSRIEDLSVVPLYPPASLLLPATDSEAMVEAASPERKLNSWSRSTLLASPPWPALAAPSFSLGLSWPAS